MSEGEGFARLVNLDNLPLFAPLLKKKAVTGQGGGSDPEAANELPDDSANQGLAADPELVAAEALFRGESVKTGMRLSPPKRPHPRPAAALDGRGLGSANTDLSGSEDVLLMRVRPRRDGTQLQVSMIVHELFMKNVLEVVSAADGSRRAIGYDYVRRADPPVKNLVRFEAPELDGMTNPVARFKWVDGAPGSVAGKILQYEVFDADKDPEGSRIFEKLTRGISTDPTTDLHLLGRAETVVSKPNLKIAQWYRLDRA